MPARPVLIIGEINVDLILSGERTAAVPGKETLADRFTMALGSASAICAVGLARLGERVVFRSLVGADPWGDFCLDVMAREGIDVSRVVRDPAVQTGVTVSISSPRDRALVTYLGAIAIYDAGDIDDGAFAGAAHAHVSSYFLQAALRLRCKGILGRARARGLTTSLDPGFDPSETWGGDLAETLREADLFFPNEVELRALGRADSPERCLHALDNGRTRTIAKLGADGAMTLDRGVPLHRPAFPVTPVDTTGAGDSFNAGYLHAFLAGRPVAECLRTASACGALSTQKPGGTGSQPTRAELDAFLAARA